MIDNYEQAIALLEKMKAHLPIPLITTKELVNSLRQNKIEVSNDYTYKIKSVLYIGDEGGICCDVSLPNGSQEAMITSLTHLRVHPRHPLSKEIKGYQKKRIKKLKKQQW